MPAHKHHGADLVVQAKPPCANGEMNITPLIDVLLVLLVIFMAALPLNQHGFDVDLPHGHRDSVPAPAPSDQIVLEYTADRQLSVNKQSVRLEGLGEQLRTVFASRNDKTMFIIGAGTLPYGEIVRVIDVAKGAGVERVGIVTEGMRRAAGVRF